MSEMKRDRERFERPRDLLDAWAHVMGRLAADVAPILPEVAKQHHSVEASAVLRASNGSGLHVQLIVTRLDARAVAALMASPAEDGHA